MKTYFTSDFHLSHENILEYCKRPFENVQQMNTVLIYNYNTIVKPEDIVYFLGDFCHFKADPEQLLKRLNGNITFIKGNHDNKDSLNVLTTSAVLTIVKKEKPYETEIFLVHDPEDANPRYRITICGHVHQHWRFKRIKGIDCINVSVDAWDYKPVELECLLQEYHKWVRGGRK